MTNKIISKYETELLLSNHSLSYIIYSHDTFIEVFDEKFDRYFMLTKDKIKAFLIKNYSKNIFVEYSGIILNIYDSFPLIIHFDNNPHHRKYAYIVMDYVDENMINSNANKSYCSII
jgi:hypothetical protein